MLLEASLCGRPAICNRTAGVPEVLDDGVTGFLSAAPEVDLFAEALERAWSNRDQWREMEACGPPKKVRTVWSQKTRQKRLPLRLLELASA